MVTSGPLLPLWDEEHREYAYDCVSCRLAGRQATQYVTFWSGDPVPRTLRLPCYAAALDSKTGLEFVAHHLFRLIDPPATVGEGQDAGGQGGDAGAPRSGA